MPGLLQRSGNLHVSKSVLAGTTPVLIPMHLPYGIPIQRTEHMYNFQYQPFKESPYV